MASSGLQSTGRTGDGDGTVVGRVLNRFRASHLCCGWGSSASTASWLSCGGRCPRRAPGRSLAVTRHADPGLPDMEPRVLTDGKEAGPLSHGSGIGLWFVHLYVRHSDGTVTVEPTDPQVPPSRSACRRRSDAGRAARRWRLRDAPLPSRPPGSPFCNRRPAARSPTGCGGCRQGLYGRRDLREDTRHRPCPASAPERVGTAPGTPRTRADEGRWHVVCPRPVPPVVVAAESYWWSTYGNATTNSAPSGSLSSTHTSPP